MPARRLLSRALAIPVAMAVTALTAIGPSAAANAAAADNVAATNAAANNVAAVPAAPATASHTVTYDGYSFLIDGKRTYLWSGEFHYFRLPSPDLWRDILTKLKAGGFNAVSLYFDWAYHSAKPGVYDFTGVRDVDKLLKMASDIGIYVIARPGPYINAEVDSGGFPAWLGTQPGRARSSDPTYLAAADEWLTHIDTILARHQLTNGTGTVITYQVENEFYDGSPAGRDYMTHLEQKAKADGITVPLVGNHNNNFNTGAGALDVDMPDAYPQGFNCSNPTVWNGVGDLSWGRSPGKPLGIGEFQGGAFDPWGGPGYDKCRQLTGPEFESVFYKQNIGIGVTQQNFYMAYGGTSWGWQSDPNQVYTSYDYGAAITESRQLTSKYDEDKRIGYFTQAVTPLTKTDRLQVAPPTSPAIVDTARINPDDHTQFHVLRHADSTSTATDGTHISLDLNAASAPPVSFTYDDADTTNLNYQGGGWQHAGAEQSWTGGDYQHTESFSPNTGDSVTVPFTGSSVRWISGKDGNHGIAQVYLDDKLVATVDGYGSTKTSQEVFYEANHLPNTAHTLRIVATGTKNAASAGTFVVVDAIDLTPTPPPVPPTYASVPQEPGTELTFAGRDSKIIVANYKLGAQQLQYSTSEIMTHAQIGDRDVALLYGRAGQAGETVLRYSSRPDVKVLDGTVNTTWNPANGDLRLNYTHTGLARVLISGGGTARPILLLLATDEVAATFWTQQTPSGPILVRGPYLVRTAMGSGTTLGLTGDTAADSDLEVFTKAHTITWNGKQVKTNSTASGSQLGSLAGPKPVSLPALTDWKHTAESPEAQPGFDDSTWQVANKTTTNSSTPPATLPVLFADDYGFHYGDVWYRGRFRGTGTETGINVSAMTGRAGAASVWLNGVFLGSGGDGGTVLPIPAGTVHAGADNLLSILVENMGHNEDYNATDTHKAARGLAGATLIGAPLTAITWRLQGYRGGENLVDPVRGPMNNGGLYGERAGWYLPGYPDNTWTSTTLPAASTTPGVSWYRTTARLDLPHGQDTSVGLRIDDDPARQYRALIFVNGWQLGRYINNVGPQHSFPIPTGILNPNGENTIAIAVWNTDGTTGGLGKVSLESYGTQASPLHVANVNSPGYQRDHYTMPSPATTAVSLTTPDTIKGGETVDASAQFTVRSGGPVSDVRTTLTVPAGWTAVATTPTTFDRVRPGNSVSVAWRVTAPAGELPAGSLLTATASYRQDDRAGTASDSRVIRSLPTPPTAGTAVSAMSFIAASNGWGPVERNTSNGESGAGDGKPITIGGTVYQSGLGVHAPSDVSLYLGGHCSRLTAAVGIDDEVGDLGSVVFSVVADGRVVFTSPTVTGTSAALPIDVNLAGAQFVDLIVSDAGDGNGYDHSDWGGAQLTCS